MFHVADQRSGNLSCEYTVTNKSPCKFTVPYFHSQIVPRWETGYISRNSLFFSCSLLINLRVIKLTARPSRPKYSFSIYLNKLFLVEEFKISISSRMSNFQLPFVHQSEPRVHFPKDRVSVCFQSLSSIHRLFLVKGFGEFPGIPTFTPPSLTNARAQSKLPVYSWQ